MPAAAHGPIDQSHIDGPLKKKKKKKKKKKGIFKKIGKSVKKAAKKTGKAVKKAAKKTGKAVKKAVKTTGKAIKKGAGKAVEVIKKATQPGGKSKASCSSAANIVDKVWAHAGTAATKVIAASGPQGVAAASVIKFVDKGVRFWNAIVGKTSKSKIGPRRMKFNKWQDGKVLIDRIIVAPFPALAPVTINFHKLGGKGKMSVAVCTRAKGKKAKSQASFTINRHTKKGHVRTIQIKNAAGKVVSVVMHQRKALKSVKWKMKVTMTGR
jgi:hypothetical protein